MDGPAPRCITGRSLLALVGHRVTVEPIAGTWAPITGWLAFFTADVACLFGAVTTHPADYAVADMATFPLTTVAITSLPDETPHPQAPLEAWPGTPGALRGAAGVWLGMAAARWVVEHQPAFLGSEEAMRDAQGGDDWAEASLAEIRCGLGADSLVRAQRADGLLQAEVSRVLQNTDLVAWEALVLEQVGWCRQAIVEKPRREVSRPPPPPQVRPLPQTLVAVCCVSYAMWSLVITVLSAITVLTGTPLPLHSMTDFAMSAGLLLPAQILCVSTAFNVFWLAFRGKPPVRAALTTLVATTGAEVVAVALAVPAVVMAFLGRARAPADYLARAAVSANAVCNYERSRGCAGFDVPCLGLNATVGSAPPGCAAGCTVPPNATHVPLCGPILTSELNFWVSWVLVCTMLLGFLVGLRHVATWGLDQYEPRSTLPFASVDQRDP